VTTATIERHRPALDPRPWPCPSVVGPRTVRLPSRSRTRFDVRSFDTCEGRYRRRTIVSDRRATHVRRPRSATVVLAVIAAALGVVAVPGTASGVEAASDVSDAGAVRVVVANVGNVSPHCAEQAFSLCLLPIEERIASSLAVLDPDVVAFIEVLPPDLCDGLTPLNPFNACASAAQDPPQVLRLLAHDRYEVVCGDRHAWDCLAVRGSIGSIEGCAGGYCGPVARSLAVDERCDDGFESFLVDITLHDVLLSAAVTHPDSTDETCRADQVSDLFAAVDASPHETIVLGDFNLDPYRESDDSVDVWDAHVGDERQLQLLSGPAEHDPPYFTLLPFESAQLDPTGSLPANLELRDLALARTVDHVVATRGLDGGCTTLGEAPGTGRLEGMEGGLDHRAIVCEVILPAADPASAGRGPGRASVPAAAGRGAGQAPPTASSQRSRVRVGTPVPWRERW
jgi:hypothetical protein